MTILCLHRETMIRKYDDNGQRLPLDQHYYVCVKCSKPLQKLNYMHKESNEVVKENPCGTSTIKV